MFIRYPMIHVSNSTFVKEARKELDLEDIKFSIQEKLVGAPIQLMFSAGGKMKIGGKNCVLHKYGEYQELKKILEDPKLVRFTRELKLDCARRNIEVNLFGMLVGDRLSPNYGVTPKLRFFDIVINKNLLSPVEMYRYFECHRVVRFISPRLGLARGIEKALAFDIKRQSTTLLSEEDTDVEENLIAGVIIKPLYSIVMYGADQFMFKLENECMKKVEVNVEELSEPEVKEEDTVPLPTYGFRRRKETSGPALEPIVELIEDPDLEKDPAEGELKTAIIIPDFGMKPVKEETPVEEKPEAPIDEDETSKDAAATEATEEG